MRWLNSQLGSLLNLLSGGIRRATYVYSLHCMQCPYRLCFVNALLSIACWLGLKLLNKGLVNDGMNPLLMVHRQSPFSITDLLADLRRYEGCWCAFFCGEDILLITPSTAQPNAKLNSWTVCPVHRCQLWPDMKTSGTFILIRFHVLHFYLGSPWFSGCPTVSLK